MFADLFVLLYAAHLLADYPLQTDHQAAHKAAPGRAGWRANVDHAACHVAVSLVLLTAGRFVLGLHVGTLPVFAALAWVGVSHAFIDRRWPVARWMRFARQTGFAAHGGAAHVDQAAHVALGLVPAALLIAGLS